MAKWSAFDESATLPYLRAARAEATVRKMSITITMPITASAYHSACTCAVEFPVSRTIARQTIATLASTRIAPSPSAARCSAFPCPY